MSGRTCVIAGATGLVGGHLFRLLAEDAAYSDVSILARRPVEEPRDLLGLSKVRAHIVDFEKCESLEPALAVDEVYCCLGTTIKKAGSNEAFRKVDLEYPLHLATAAAKAGSRQFLIVTAVGSSSKSGIFYNRVKGELEDALASLSFPDGVKIFRPSLILGERKESRPAERASKAIMSALNGLFVGGLAKYRAIEAMDIARAMRNAARHDRGTNRVYEGRDLFARSKDA